MSFEAPYVPWGRSTAVSQQLVPFLEWLLSRHAVQGGFTEIRVIGTDRRVQSAIVAIDDLARIPHWLAPVVDKAHVYFSLNPVDPRRHDRCALRPTRTAVRDDDVLAYSMMAIDIDAERHPRGRSASDGEKEAAREVGEKVREWLIRKGARPLVADSGNGVHLLVPLVPRYGEEIGQAARDARTLLRMLDKRFSTDRAHVDLSTFNPSRILKLY